MSSCKAAGPIPSTSFKGNSPKAGNVSSPSQLCLLDGSFDTGSSASHSSVFLRSKCVQCGTPNVSFEQGISPISELWISTLNVVKLASPTLKLSHEIVTITSASEPTFVLDVHEDRFTTVVDTCQYPSRRINTSQHLSTPFNTF